MHAGTAACRRQRGVLACMHALCYWYRNNRASLSLSLDLARHLQRSMQTDTLFCIVDDKYYLL